MIFEILLKSAVLIAVIHILRHLGRRFGPRASGILLGLPSSTAVLLVLCGREKGVTAAVEMADASLLGLIAAVSLPVGFAEALRRGWRLAGAIATAVAAYVVVASGLGYLSPGESVNRLVISGGSILAASWLVSRVGVPPPGRPTCPPSRRSAALVRTVFPAFYVATAGLVVSMASPRWGGLVGTFPSVSTAILAVTHLEGGAAAACRIARALPPASLSTAAFLGAFRFASPRLGLGWGMVIGYAAALLHLALMEAMNLAFRRPVVHQSWSLRIHRREAVLWKRASRALRCHMRTFTGPRTRPSGRNPTRRRSFAPRVEIMPC